MNTKTRKLLDSIQALPETEQAALVQSLETPKQQPPAQQSPSITDLRQLAMPEWPDEMTAEQVDAFIQELRSANKKQ